MTGLRRVVRWAAAQSTEVLAMPDFADLHRQRQQHPHVTQQLLGRSTGSQTQTAISTADMLRQKLCCGGEIGLGESQTF
jgi:hypothetical protein